MEGTPASNWKVVFDKHQAALVEELSAFLLADREQATADATLAERQRLSAEHEEALAQAIERERARADEQVERASVEARTEGGEAAVRTTAEGLNQALRRLRQAATETSALEILADASSLWAQKAVVLSIDSTLARSRASRGLDQTSEITFSTETAGAVHSAIESKDPVIAVVSATELSPELSALLANGTEGRKAYLFPLVVRHSVLAMLIASGAVSPAPLELLCEAAAMKLEILTTLVPVAAPEPVAAPAPALVQIQQPPATPPAAAPPAVPQATSWADLSADDQKLHLHAQRVARVRVAELRLYSAEELRKGVFEGDIYGALHTGIDAARAEFLQSFLSKSPTMVDYLHLEIVRSLAHDDARLLGKQYPGPMV